MLVSPITPFSFIIGEDPLVSRNPVSILYSAGPSLAAGTVIAKTPVAAAQRAHVTRDWRNSGMGTLTPDEITPVSPGVGNGIYEIVLTGAGPTAAFNLLNPAGAIIGSGNVGTAFAGALNFILTAGGTMKAGDTWLIDIFQPDDAAYLWGALDTSQTNGLQTAAGVLLSEVLADSQAQPAMGLTRSATVSIDDLVWPAGFTAQQIAAGVSQLAAVGIVGDRPDFHN
jgi:Bacteriophage lambda head decoration protein D